MKRNIFLIHFICKNCKEEIKGTVNLPKILINKNNGYEYTKVNCPYCQKEYYIRNEDREPIIAIGNLDDEDFITDSSQF